MSRAVATAVFIAIAIGILSAIHGYLWMRLVRDPAWPPPYRQLGTALVVALGASIPVLFMGSRILGVELPRAVLWAVFAWMGLMFFFLVVLVTTDVVRLVAGGALKLAHASPALASPARRSLLARLIGGGAVFVVGSLGLVATRTALAGPVTRRVRIPLARLPHGLEGLKIVQLTDIHVGPTLDGDYVRQVVEKTNALAPDVVAITGDLVDASVEELREAVAPLAALRAPHGVYFVTGNHEYYAGVEAWLRELPRLGIRVLHNERVTIGEGEATLEIAGVDDWSARRFGRGHGPDLARALEGRDPSRPVLLLAHQPKQIFEAAAADVDLQLSGHTHAGQLWPFGYLVHLVQPYVVGLHRHGPTTIYVSPGTGYWGPPMRLGTRSEVTLIELVRDAEPAVEA